MLGLPGNDGIAYGINDAGEIVGDFISGGVINGFADVDGSISTINVPGARFTEVSGINDAGQISGEYFVGNQNYGFIATPVGIPEPASLGLLSFGLIALGWFVTDLTAPNPPDTRTGARRRWSIGMAAGEPRR